MAHGVSSGVRSIIDSFVNGLDILSRLREKHKRKKPSTGNGRDTSMQLSRSLQQGPHEIGWEYHRGTQALGERFAQGDGIAQNSLSEILLKLNTGLVTIIASFLDNDKRGRTVDYSSLTSLSEASRRDSLHVLRRLYQRMETRQLPAQIGRPHDRREERTKKSRSHSTTKQSKIRGPTIARVTIEDSSRRPQLAVVKPGVKRKSPASSSPNLSKLPSYSSSTTAVDSVLSTRQKSPRLLASTPQMSKERSMSALKSAPQQRQIPAAAKSSPRLPTTTPEMTKERSMSNLKPVSPRRQTPVAARSSPGLLPAYSELDTNHVGGFVKASMPPHVVRRPQVIGRRKETPTMYSIATDSTKLGEIPHHKWAVPYDFDAMSTLNREAMQSGWPLTDLDGNAVFKPKKRFGLFCMFKRRETA